MLLFITSRIFEECPQDGPARNVIKGLTQAAESYQEAVRCLKDRYDRPRLAHREHVSNMLDVSPEG